MGKNWEFFFFAILHVVAQSISSWLIFPVSLCCLCMAELCVGLCWHQYQCSLNIAEEALGINCRAVIRAGRHGRKHWKCLPSLPFAAELFLNSLSQPYSLEEQEQMLSCLSIDSPFVSDASEKVSGGGWGWLAGPLGKLEAVTSRNMEFLTFAAAF